MRRLDASEPGFAAEFDALVDDRRESDSDVSADVAAIIARVKAEGDIALAPGKTYNFGFAIHDDHTVGRFHQVSLGYTLGVDTKGDITAGKQ